MAPKWTEHETRSLKELLTQSAHHMPDGVIGELDLACKELPKCFKIYLLILKNQEISYKNLISSLENLEKLAPRGLQWYLPEAGQAPGSSTAPLVPVICPSLASLSI